MRRACSRGLWLGLLILPAVGALLGRGRAYEQEMDPVSVLIRQLGSARFTERDAATRELTALGEPVIPALLKALHTGESLELRRRARQLILTILPATRKSKSLGLQLVRVHPGAFDMGSPLRENHRRGDETLHEVVITLPFYIGVHEVAQEEYRKVMGVNPSWFSHMGGGKLKVARMDTRPFPVESVSWYDAIEFCNRLSKLDGLQPYYRITGDKRRDDSIVNAEVTIVGGSGYRLPTEAEWEHSCRDGTISRFHFGYSNNGRQANLRPSPGAGGYGGGPTWRSLDRTTQVGSYDPNSRGLKDMHGNVDEWCWDWYDKDYYTNSPRQDPSGPRVGIHKAVRGGSWLVAEGDCRSASRFWRVPGERSYTGGFRVARGP